MDAKHLGVCWKLEKTALSTEVLSVSKAIPMSGSAMMGELAHAQWTSVLGDPSSSQNGVWGWATKASPAAMRA